MYTNYIQNYLRGDENTAIEDGIAQWEQDEQDKYDDLLDFIDEFVDSKEYEDYIQCKMNIIKTSVGTQYNESDFVGVANLNTIIGKNYPLTLYSKKMFAFITRFRNYVQKKKTAEIVDKQMKGIKIIKGKIAMFKKYTILHAETIKRRNEKVLNDFLEEFCEMFHVEWTKVAPRNKRTKDRIASFSKMLRTRYINRKKIYSQIVRKITEEIKRDKKILAKAKKGFSYQVKTTEWTVKDLEIVGIGYKEQERVEKKPLIRYAFETPIFNTSDLQTDNFSRIQSEDYVIKRISETSIKSKKEKNKKPPKKEKEVAKFVAPIPRIKNVRKKIIGEEIENMCNILNEFQKLDEIMESQYLARNSVDTKECELDKCFLCKPKTILFNDYVAGKTYKRMIKVQNVNFETRKFRFVRVICEDEYDTLLFRLTPLIGIQKVISGCSVTMCLIFTPEIDAFVLDAKLEFLSFDKATQSYQKFFIQIKCVPKLIHFQISSDNVYFGKMHMWQKKSGYKIITLSNDGSLPCSAIIKTIKDPLDIEECVSEDFKSITEVEDIMTTIQEILDDIVDDVVYSHFEFESICICLAKRSSRRVKICMKNFDHIGDYLGKYVVEVYDKEHNLIGSHDILLHGEVIGHFIRTMPEEVDFGVCMINSSYQAKLDIENMSSSTQAVAVKYPSAMNDHVRFNVSNIFLPPNSIRTLWIRLSPRRTVTSCCYFNPEYSILEFPVHIYIMTNNYTDATPVKAIIYAILTTSMNLNLNPVNSSVARASTDGIFLNIGDCTIFETVSTDIVLENKSLAPQIYGFLNLPKCLTITPNYGFGAIQSDTKQTLTLHFHPDFQNLLKKFNEEKCKDFAMKFKVSVDILCNIPQMKKEINIKKLRTSINFMMKELKKPVNKHLIADIFCCIESIKTELFPNIETSAYLEQTITGEQSITENNSPVSTLISTSSGGAEEYGCEKYHYNTETTLPDTQQTSITIEANVVKPLVEVSAQCMILPDTPCSSYSALEFEIRALRMEFSEETVFLKNRDLKLPKFEAWFKITGDNKIIRVEPSCGILKNGDTRKIFLIVKPTLPEEFVAKFAKSIRFAEIYNMRIKEIEEELNTKPSLKDKLSLKDKKEDKKDDKSSLKMKKGSITSASIHRQASKKSHKEFTGESETDPKIKISDSELVVTAQDYFPAEMCYWRSLQPYTIRSKLTCTVNYESQYMHRKKEVIYINVICKVVRPDFILNDVKSQRVHFGKVAVGMRGVHYVMIQNIRYDPIVTKVSALDPLGPFRIPYLKSYLIPPECYLKLPIYFEPTEPDKQVEECLEISSGRTIVPLIIQGTGVKFQVHFSPQFSICRLTEATGKKCDECPVKIQNESDGPVTITIEKIFQIEGTLKPLPNQNSASDTGKTMNKKKSKSDKDEIKSKETKRSDLSSKKFANELTSFEIYSFNDFLPSNESHFELLNVSKTITLEPNSTSTVIIGFGMENTLSQRKEELINKVKLKRDSKEKDISAKNSLTEKLCYATKYNFTVRHYFLKDYIFVGTFK